MSPSAAAARAALPAGAASCDLTLTYAPRRPAAPLRFDCCFDCCSEVARRDAPAAGPRRTLGHATPFGRDGGSDRSVSPRKQSEGWLLMLFALMLGVAPAVLAHGGSSRAPLQLEPGQRQLMIDDSLLDTDDAAQAAGTAPVVRMHPAQKTGQVSIVADKPWEGVIFYYDSIVQVSDDEFRIYYECVSASLRSAGVSSGPAGPSLTECLPCCGCHACPQHLRAQGSVPVRSSVQRHADLDQASPAQRCVRELYGEQ